MNEQLAAKLQTLTPDEWRKIPAAFMARISSTILTEMMERVGDEVIDEILAERPTPEPSLEMWKPEKGERFYFVSTNGVDAGDTWNTTRNQHASAFPRTAEGLELAKRCHSANKLQRRLMMLADVLNPKGWEAKRYEQAYAIEAGGMDVRCISLPQCGGVYFERRGYAIAALAQLRKEGYFPEEPTP